MTEYIVKQIDFGRPKSIVAGPTDKQSAIEKANQLVKEKAENSRVDPHLYEDTSDSYECEGAARHAMSRFELRAIDA
jgi:recombinational DNA repair protein (RecF pathway)